ncbi:hypothetical protein CS542_10005 [Pedobacter sp. IW39]|nr:hypothetical protein CS542_10005 [Pedobacter sp. IW39]
MLRKRKIILIDIPTLILLIFVVTMVFSILATRPTVPPGTFSQQILMKKVNLLFLVFYRMALPDYVNECRK